MEHFEWLARDQKSKGGFSGHWRDFLQAHGRANFRLSEESTETTRREVYKIEESWYKGKHPLTYSEHQVLTAEHKQLLKRYREETSADFDALDGLVGELSADDAFSEQNLTTAKEFCTKLFALSEKCSKGFESVAKSFIKSSVDILERQQERCPCKFAVIALGSVAKGEATPYSDLEYAFLVEKNDDYFEKLAMDSYFRIGNLGETPLTCFDIPEQKEPYSLPVRQGQNLNVGFRIDGITKFSGNIPTGNGSGSKPLTFTVEELMEFYNESATSPFDGFPGDKADMLSPASLIFTNEETEKSQLLEEYIKLRNEYESKKAKCDKTVREKRMASFVMDMKSYSFLPDFVSYQPPKNLNIKVKTDIFRYPTLLANNLKMCMGLNISYPWETYTYLKEQGILSADGHLYLSIVLALSIYIRTKAYIKHKSKTDLIQILPTMTDVSADKYYMPLNLFVLLGYLLIPVKQSVNAGLTKLQSLIESESTKDEVVLVMPDLQELQTNHLQKAEVLYFTGQYDSAKKELSKAVGQSLESASCFTFRSAICRLSEQPMSPKTPDKYLELSSYLLYYTNNYKVALDYFNWLIDNKWDRPGFWKLLAAHCHQENRDLVITKRLLEEANADLREDTLVYSAEFKHQDTAILCRKIGHVYHTLSEYHQAKEYFQNALAIDKAINGDNSHPDIAADYSGIARACFRLSEYALSIEYSDKSLAMYKEIHGEDANHLDIATEYDNIGEVYSQIGKYTQSLPYFLKAVAIYEAIYEAIYGADTKCHRMCLANLGALHMLLGNYQESLDYLHRSLNMSKAVYGVNASNADIAATYYELGETSCESGDYPSAIEFYRQAQEMYEEIYGADADHEYIAINYNGLGRLYNRLGRFETALQYLNKALAMCEAVYGSAANNTMVKAVNCDRMGFAHSGLGNDEVALEYLEKSLVMYKRTSGAESKHPYIVNVYKKCAEIYRKQGDEMRTLEYDTKASNLL